MQNHVDLLPPPHKEQKHDSANSEKQRTLHSLVIEIELEIHSNAPKQQPESCLEQRGEFPVNWESTPSLSPFSPAQKSWYLELKS